MDNENNAQTMTDKEIIDRYSSLVENVVQLEFALKLAKDALKRHHSKAGHQMLTKNENTKNIESGTTDVSS